MGFVNFDRYAEMQFKRALVTTTIAANATTTGAVVDTGAPGSANQAKHVTFIVHTGTITDGSYALQVFEDDVVGMGTETQIPAGRVFGATTIAATDDDTVISLSVKHSKRFIRLKIVSTGVTTGGTNFNAVAILERF